jgi:arsenite-transporting ATPase
MTQYLFFSGKGGVGKTSLSSAAAVQLAHEGYRTLLVTTDPASNLGDVFEQAVTSEPREVAQVDGLFIQEINAAQALHGYKERALAPLRALFPDNIVSAAEEKMNGPCTEEVATFDQFIACMQGSDYDWVVFDTAPTGHTLRLLELPASWSSHITQSAAGSGQTCMGPVSDLIASQREYEVALSALQDGSRSTMVFVTQPSELSIEEMLRAADELAKLGIVHQRVVINGVIPEDERADAYAGRRWRRQEPFVRSLPDRFSGPVGIMPLYADDIRGMVMLNRVGRDLRDAGLL